MDLNLFTGLFSLFGWQFDLNVLAAVLATVGYSLNDTIVIFDRIRDNIFDKTVTIEKGTLQESIMNLSGNP